MGIASDDANGASVDFANAAGLVADPITVMGWLKWRVDSGNTTLSVWDGASNRCHRMSAATGPTEMRSRISTDGSNQLSTSSSTALTLNQWYHMALMYDGTDLEFWLDGVEDATSVNAGGLFASTGRFAIGGQQGGANTCDADHADVRVYSRLMSPEEMQTIFAARGHDGIVNGLEFRAQLNEGGIGTLVSAINPADIGPIQVAYFGQFGTPVPAYVEDPGLSFRKAA